MSADPPKPTLKVLLCSPRGFCAGVVRAIESVERALTIYGAPVYVRHEIVHNKYVVDSLRKKGAIFVEELSEIPDDNVPVIFSAHGVPRSVPEEASRRNLISLDATCPLVTKVHREAEIQYRRGREILLMGMPAILKWSERWASFRRGSINLVQTTNDIDRYKPRDERKLAYVTRTTLSVERSTAEMVDHLKKRFPNIVGPHKEDICYATARIARTPSSAWHQSWTP